MNTPTYVLSRNKETFYIIVVKVLFNAMVFLHSLRYSYYSCVLYFLVQFIQLLIQKLTGIGVYYTLTCPCLNSKQKRNEVINSKILY